MWQFKDNMKSPCHGTVLYLDAGHSHMNLCMWENCVNTYTHKGTYKPGEVWIRSMDSINGSISG